MKKLNLFLLALLTIFICSKVSAGIIQKLSVSSNGHLLQKADGTAYLPIGDTAWRMSYMLDRSDVAFYIDTRYNQKYNAFGLVAYEDVQDNAYADNPFQVSVDHFDVTQPITTTGNDPNYADQYDYWDHLEYIIDYAASKGMYVFMLPTWGDTTIHDNDWISETAAYTYGQWLGSRFSSKTNIVWMMGGDCIPVDAADVAIYDKMAEGVADGVNGVNNNDGSADYSTTMISYHPPKWTQSSSYWFHNKSWLDFNSTQDQPIDQDARIRGDYSKTPAKPTWLFEGGYDERSTPDGIYGAWQCRYQAYATIFAGGFGHTYGHMSLWDFLSDWKTKIYADSAADMTHLVDLMNSISNNLLNIIPADSILDGWLGNPYVGEGIKSSQIVAEKTTAGDLALVYFANGSSITVKMNLLAGPGMKAQWFNPRDGSYTLISTNLPSGTGAADYVADPPGAPADENDWVLVLGAVGSDSGSGDDYETDAVLHFSDNFNSADGDVSANESTYGRQAGDWAVCDEVITNSPATITGNRVSITRGSAFYPNHTLNSIYTNFNVSCDAYVANYAGTYVLFGTELHGTDHYYNWWFQDGTDRPVFQIDGANQWTRSNYRNNEWDNNSANGYTHINTLYSSIDSTHFWTVCFCNGEPITAGQSNQGTILRIANTFPLSAYMRLTAWAGTTSADVAVDNLVIKSTSPNFNIADWTSDASSLISSDKIYTHAINCGGGSITINGVAFTGHNTPSATSGTNWKILNNVNETSMTAGTQSTTISGSGAALAQSYYTAAPCSTLILSGLSAGTVYTLTLYSNADAPNIDTAVATSDEDGGITTLNASGSNKGKTISLVYKASSQGKFSITFDTADTSTSTSFQLYAFSNQTGVPECSIFFGLLTMIGMVIRK